MNRPQWSWRQPTTNQVTAFLATQDGATWSYAEVGASRHNAERPRGYDLDHNRVRIGEGEPDYAVACAAIRQWRMFPAPWTRIAPRDAALQIGETVAMQAH